MKSPDKPIAMGATMMKPLLDRFHDTWVIEVKPSKENYINVPTIGIVFSTFFFEHNLGAANE